MAGVTIRGVCSGRGSSRASADKIARSGQVRRGLATWRRNTATSWRRIRISTFLAAALRVSSSSQPNSLIVVRYSSRNNTTGDHAMLTKGRRNRSSSHPVASLARHRHLALETTTSLVALMVALGAIGAMPEGRNVEAAHRPFP